MRTTKASISPAMRGRPGARCAVPSYFWAINFRCQANKVSGVTRVAISARTLRPNVLALTANLPALVVIEAYPPAAELLSKNAILLAKVINDLQLALVHPAGDGDQQESEWVKDSLDLQSPLSRAQRYSWEQSQIQADPVFGPFGRKVSITWRTSARSVCVQSGRSPMSTSKGTAPGAT